MENLAHTLLGLSLAKAGLERATPLATTTLVIASNLPDVDVLSSLTGGTVSYLNHHRGFTHSFVGLALLAVAFAFVITYLDRKVRLRLDAFRRPVRPLRIFWLAYLGGLGHTYMDFTNNYGVRPLLPFSGRWVYGDITFVVDPWIWLILGSSVVWLTTRDSLRAFIWLIVGVVTSLLIALAYRNPVEAQTPLPQVPIPLALRAVWFAGLAIIILGALLGWRRAGAKLARYSLLLLALYYGGMWMAQQTARRQAETTLPVDGVARLSVWPTPANPLLWQSTATDNQHIYTRYVDFPDPSARWRELATLDPKFIEALRQSEQARIFMGFSRYTAATVNEQPEGYTILLRDVRFPLQMSVVLDRDLAVKSTEVRWL